MAQVSAPRSCCNSRKDVTIVIVIPVNNTTAFVCLFVCVLTCGNFQERQPGYHQHRVFESQTEPDQNDYIFITYEGHKKSKICSKGLEILSKLKSVVKVERTCPILQKQDEVKSLQKFNQLL